MRDICIMGMTLKTSVEFCESQRCNKIHSKSVFFPGEHKVTYVSPKDQLICKEPI